MSASALRQVSYWLVMPAAGVGRRFGEDVPKQYAALCGRTVVEWALEPFLTDPRCRGAVLALADGDAYWQPIGERLPAITLATGGAERSESVRNALAALSGRAGPEDWVLIHDAARPCLSHSDRDRLIEHLADHPIGGLLATRAADTLKRSGADQAVEETLARTSLWRALTPQMFRYRGLFEALDAAIAAHRFPTDEAQALEWLGRRPQLVEGSSGNIKITSTDDLRLAEAILSTRTGVAYRAVEVW